MPYARVLTIQDISCVGQCSLTVALPILSACGLETAILPSAVLSTHTGGFTGYTFRDLSDDMPSIQAHWQKEGIRFNAFYTGYLGSSRQVDYVLDIVESTGADGSKFIADPAMADNGKLYAGFDADYVQAMKRLCREADYILPNITEACLLTDTEYRTAYDREYIKLLLDRLHDQLGGTVVLTGVGYSEDRTGVLVSGTDGTSYYEHPRLAHDCHGTGDIFASAFTGALVKGARDTDAARIAADYTVGCIEETMNDPAHWYGAKFEPVLPRLIQALEALH